MPEPLGPMMTNISPGSTSKLTFLSTLVSSNFFESASTLTPTALASTPVNGLRVLLQEDCHGDGSA